MSTQRRSGLKKSSSRSSKARSELVKALTDLKIATALQPTPRVVDVPRILLKPRKYTVAQNWFFGNLSSSTSAPAFAQVNFSLGNSPIASAFEGCFDSWRILQATVRFVPLTQPAIGSTFAPLLTVLDYDDSVAPTTTAQLRAYDTLQEVPFGHYQERTVIPKLALAAYQGAFTAYAMSSSWIDCAYPNVLWYGVKAGIDTTAIAYAAYGIEVDCVFQFRSVR